MNNNFNNNKINNNNKKNLKNISNKKDENEEKFDEISTFFENINNYQKKISKVVDTLKNEIKNLNYGEEEISKNYKKAKEDLIEIMDELKETLKNEPNSTVDQIDPDDIVLEKLKIKDIYDKYKKDFVKINEENNKNQYIKNEINTFFENIDNYQKMISTEINKLKKEIKFSSYDKIPEIYKKIKKTKRWIYWNIDDSKDKFNSEDDYSFNFSDIIDE